MKSLFRWSHEEGHISKNPATKIKEPKSGKRIPKFLTEMEIEHLGEACCSPMENALFEFMFSTGNFFAEYFLGFCQDAQIIKPVQLIEKLPFGFTVL
ncbi:hypothetical protein [Bacillus sp. X1(2014)]|uniref:hypothetical protein n=1 Tax=Bacillus sp. X1(2014) TaxID=1565991 RepID=UPI0028CB7095|nr:hypothetical protein [Bacillus sp. X1(2014)]